MSTLRPGANDGPSVTVGDAVCDWLRWLLMLYW